MPVHILLAVCLLLLTLPPMTLGHDAVLITEVMAANNGSLADEDGDFVDWIEIHNTGSNVVDLIGWSLTDNANDLARWRFPTTTLAPNAYLVVFASGKDRRLPGAPLHTSFRLANEGEYLALVRPDRTNIASVFAPGFPPQVGDVSYGVPVTSVTTTLVATGALGRVYVPSNDVLGLSWTSVTFDPATWQPASTGIGYETDNQIPFVPVLLADSRTQFGGSQGQDNWFYGYWNKGSDNNHTYSASEFVPFPNSGGPFGSGNFWTGSIWNWPNGDPPSTELTRDGGQPSGDPTSATDPLHWTIRRYVNETDGPLTLSGRITHTSDWIQVTATGLSSSRLLYLYLLGVGEGYIDDISVVAGGVAASGPNLVADGSFEAATLTGWTVSPNLTNSSLTTAIKHSGNQSLRIVSTAAGSSQGTAIWQALAPTLTNGGTFTLRYYYLPKTNSTPLIVRFSGGWIETTPTICSDGVFARIFVDGEPVFDHRALVSSAEYSLTVPAQLGSRVDFVLDPGPTNDGRCDTATFTAGVRSADPTLATLADSVADWSFRGKQGENNWYYGYWNAGPTVPIPAYDLQKFTPFPRSNSPYSTNNWWDGRSWDWWNGDPPLDEIGQRVMNPNGLNFDEIHWVIRRWISEVSGPVTVVWTMIKPEASGAGVTGRVFHQGVQRDAITLPGTNAPVITRRVDIPNVAVGDAIDIVLDPTGEGGAYGDGGDRCFVSAIIRGRPSLTTQIQSDLRTALRGVNASAYIRIPFQVADPASIQFLTLLMKYDDGFVAYLNGLEVARANAPVDPAWNSTAVGPRSDSDANQFQEFNLTEFRGVLVPGANVLAIQGLNASVADSDFLVLPELLASRETLDPGERRYFTSPTPGTANGVGQTNLGPLVLDVLHLPKVLRPEESLVVTARLLPTVYPVAEVRLLYRIMYSNELSVLMFDDGAHADGASGDGTYGAFVPAGLASPGQMVRYCIFATDIHGASTRFPNFGDPLNSPEYKGTIVLDRSLSNNLPVLHMFVQDPTLATNLVGTRCSLFYDEEFYDNVGVNLHGQTTTAVFRKRSMNIDLNRGETFRWSRTAAPVDDFNLLTPFADKAYVRQTLAWETFANAGVPAHFAFPVRLQQNGAFFGVFHLVEKGDDHFLERLKLDPKGALYKVYLPLTNAYGGVAEKKTRQNEPYDDLQELIDGLKISGPGLRRYLFDNIDIPEVINFLATLQLVQNEDCCFFKNYYLYRDTQKTREWQMLPWDLDLVFGRTFGFFTITNVTFNGYFNTNIYWTNAYYFQTTTNHDFIGVSQPLADAIFRTPETYQMFQRRWTTIQDDFLRVSNTHPLLLRLERRIDELAAQIGPDAALDFGMWGNWYPTQSMSVAVEILKRDYLGRRRGWIFNTLAAANGGPYLGPQPSNAIVRFGVIEFNPDSGQAEEYLQITNLNTYAVDVSGWKVTGGIEHTFKPGTVIAARDVLYLSPDVTAFRARSNGPRGGQGLFVQGDYEGRLSARGETLQLTDTFGRVVQSTNYAGEPSAAQRYLRVTEMMFHPPAEADFDSEAFEYLELKNISPASISLLGVRFTSGIDFTFAPGSTITNLGGHQSVILARNTSAFRARYDASLPIAGQYAGQLDNAGEQIRLEDSTGEIILEFTYDNSWFPITDGFGFSLVIVDENAPASAWNDPSNWRASGRANGSPGQPDPASPLIIPVLVSEALTHTQPPAIDAVELLNPSATLADLSGWFLSDDFRDPKKFRIPNNTVIPAGGRHIFTEADFNPTDPPSGTAFALSSFGDEIYLFSASALGELTGYFHGFSYGAADPGISFGLHVTSLGEEHFVAQSNATLGTFEQGPKIGPVVISEIHFHAADSLAGVANSEHEFVELRNLTPDPVLLSDPSFPAHPWMVKGGIEFSFPSGLVLPANGTALLLNFDPTNTTKLSRFRSQFPLPTSTLVLGPYSGTLNHAEDVVELFKPQVPVGPDASDVLVDRVHYHDAAPWPRRADGAGLSLHRLAHSYGDDPAAWIAARPGPGSVYFAHPAPLIVQQPVSVTTGVTMKATLTVEATGGFPLGYQWLFNDLPLPGAIAPVLSLSNLSFAQAGRYRVVVYNAGGATESGDAILNLLLPPYILREPTNALVRITPDPQAAPVTNANFAVEVRGSGPIRYQWRFRETRIEGATNHTLIVPNVRIADGGEYSVVITDDVGAIASPPATLYPLITPMIVSQPLGQAVAVGSQVTLSIAVVANPLPIEYEWRRGSRILATNTTHSLVDFFRFTATNAPATTPYRVIIRNLANSLPGIPSTFANIVTLADTDGDGIPDERESNYGLDPNVADGSLDTDGDGLSNWEEYISGTDLTNALSYLKIDSLRAGAGAWITFAAVSNHTYTVEFASDPSPGHWSKLMDVPAHATNRVESLFDPAEAIGRYYRLATPQKP